MLKAQSVMTKKTISCWRQCQLENNGATMRACKMSCIPALQRMESSLRGTTSINAADCQTEERHEYTLVPLHFTERELFLMGVMS